MNKQRLQRAPAEQRYSDELEKLTHWDPGPLPPGWRLSPRAVEKFILGDRALAISRKLVAPRSLVTRTIVTLATNRGAMLIGQPGTAKSWLSELLAAAISGSSTTIVQGGVIDNREQLLYSWNKSIVQQRGPCIEALIPGAVYQAMQQGLLLRFEELARCAPSIQDAILSVLSERLIVIPELQGEHKLLFANEGFNIIGTANNLDRGLHEMSTALKRRLNFETIRPIPDLGDELEVVSYQVQDLLDQSTIEVSFDSEVLRILVTVFHELRNGQSIDGRSTDRLSSAAMSTAEAIAAAHAMAVHAFYYGDSIVRSCDLIDFLIGTAIKNNEEDRRRLLHYFDSEVANKKGQGWRELYQQRSAIR